MPFRRRAVLPTSEEGLHHQVCEYLRLKYPDVLFRTDMGGVRLTPFQASKAKKTQAGRAWPDLFIAEYREKIFDRTGRFPQKNGLFLELKREGTKLYLKDGVTMVANQHYREQAEVLQKLRDRRYKAEFAVGIDECMRIIDEYLK